ncbi:MAG: phosphoenolpyruvate carboxykinase [Alphaproteobacteria bacterium]
MNEHHLPPKRAGGSARPDFGSGPHHHRNLHEAALVEHAIRNEEANLSSQGALVALTGQHTGRSAQDKFVVRRPASQDEIWWDNCRALAPEHFRLLLEDARAHAGGMRLYVQDLYAGADPEHRIRVRVVTEYAWHSLFIRHLLIEPGRSELEDFEPDYLIVDLPSFRADPERHRTRSETVIACDFDERTVFIGGTSYAGEIKKSVFTILNHLLPERDVLPMHCSVNVGPGNDAAVFFGLSGTGKTTLSADPARTLIGDDEHGWSSRGLFNFEGGCYAKVIRLSREAEPEIYATTERFATVLENVVMDPETGNLDLDDARYTENTRGAYPLNYIPNASPEGRAGHPRNVIMLTCDAFGVLPPVARLTPDQAMYHFLSGYTAKVAGTEKGVTEPVATFSTCFGAPFLPRHPSVYGNLLRGLIDRHDTRCWLLNTGWTGGAYGTGRRMPIAETRAILAAVLDGRLEGAETRRDAHFGFEVPRAVPGVDPRFLDPRSNWQDAQAYDATAERLVRMFMDNFAVFSSHVDDRVRAAAPVVA